MKGIKDFSYHFLVLPYKSKMILIQYALKCEAHPTVSVGPMLSWGLSVSLLSVGSQLVLRTCNLLLHLFFQQQVVELWWPWL